MIEAFIIGALCGAGALGYAAVWFSDRAKAREANKGVKHTALGLDLNGNSKTRPQTLAEATQIFRQVNGEA
jgi:hypothetical protein